MSQPTKEGPVLKTPPSSKNCIDLLRDYVGIRRDRMGLVSLDMVTVFEWRQVQSVVPVKVSDSHQGETLCKSALMTLVLLCSTIYIYRFILCKVKYGELEKYNRIDSVGKSIFKMQLYIKIGPSVRI